MLTKSKKLLNAVKKLYTKVTGGKTTKSNDLPTVIDSMAENYQGGSGGTSMYLVSIYASIHDYAGSISMLVDTNTLETYDNLFDYLVNKGCNGKTDPFESGYSRFYCCTGFSSGGLNIIGLIYDERSRMVQAVASEGNHYILSDEDFSITYLGND